MRTTVVLDDQLFRRAKQRAAKLNLTLSEVVNQALRQALAEPAVKVEPFSMITHGNPRKRTRHEPRDFARALEDEDLEGGQ
jgi:hypothetical protein